MNEIDKIIKTFTGDISYIIGLLVIIGCVVGIIRAKNVKVRVSALIIAVVVLAVGGYSFVRALNDTGQSVDPSLQKYNPVGS